MKINNNDIISSGDDNYSLVSFDWSVIDKCNYNCTYCFAGFHNKNKNKSSKFHINENTHNAYIRVLKKLRLNRMPKFEVSLVGGEPTNHPEIKTIVKDLDNNDNCIDVAIVTNTYKRMSYFEELDRLNLGKLSIISSIHLEYHSQSDLEKYKSISKLKNIRYQPTIMLHDDPKYIEDIEYILDYFTVNDIEYSVTFIEPFDAYKPRYTDKFYEAIKPYINNFEDNSYIFRTDKQEYKLTRDVINSKNYKRFKGWKCKPLLWTIDVNGEFRNACTGEVPSLLFNNLTLQKICPLNSCSCDIKWRFPKSK